MKCPKCERYGVFVSRDKFKCSCGWEQGFIEWAEEMQLQFHMFEVDALMFKQDINELKAKVGLIESMP